jgi:hypothetical protein
MRHPVITFRVARAVVVAGGLVIALTTTVADAQSTSTPTCVIAQRALTTSEQSMVNDYEVQVARANSKHTPVPPMPDPVVALIGCESPASQVSQASSSGSLSTSPSTTTASTPSTTASSSTGASTTFHCPPNGLSKAQQSMINDYEILVARANSKHTPVPMASPDILALIACE